MHKTRCATMLLLIAAHILGSSMLDGTVEHSAEAPGKEMLSLPRKWIIREGFLGEVCLQTVKGGDGEAVAEGGNSIGKGPGAERAALA